MDTDESVFNPSKIYILTLTNNVLGALGALLKPESDFLEMRWAEELGQSMFGLSSTARQYVSRSTQTNVEHS